MSAAKPDRREERASPGPRVAAPAEVEKLWFKIGEVAIHLGVSPKELRYWETLIPEIKPRRSTGNLRYYHREQFPKLERLRDWIRSGLTVADCRQLLKTGALAVPLDLGLSEEDLAPAPKPAKPAPPPKDLQKIVKALKALRDRLAKPLP
jgi:DNA-binding transcriptional MerR regulator